LVPGECNSRTRMPPYESAYLRKILVDPGLAGRAWSAWWWSDWSYKPWNRSGYCNNLPCSGTSKVSFILRGTRRCNWLRHCAVSRKVAGWFTDGVIGIFNWLNPSGRTVTLGSAQLERVAGVRSGGKGGWCVVLTTLQTPYADYLESLGASSFYSPQGLSRPL
jgi:hypothetical protein